MRKKRIKGRILMKNFKQNFFYLDAHGPIIKNPLLRELDIIFGKFTKFINNLEKNIFNLLLSVVESPYQV